MCKPSEMTSLTAFMLCELIKEIGFPKGVINMIFGEVHSSFSSFSFSSPLPFF